jgi:hypothetical protein
MATSYGYFFLKEYQVQTSITTETSKVSPNPPVSVPPENSYLVNFKCYHDITNHLTFKYFNKTNAVAMKILMKYSHQDSETSH